MKDLTNYYVLQNVKTTQYVNSIYQYSTSEQSSIDDAMKFPEKEAVFAVRKYLEWRNENVYRIMRLKTTFEEVEE